MTNNDKTKRLKKEKFIAGTALFLGMTTFGVAGHADGVTVGSSSDASGISSEASTVVSSSTATLSSNVLFPWIIIQTIEIENIHWWSFVFVGVC